MSRMRMTSQPRIADRRAMADPGRRPRSVTRVMMMRICLSLTWTRKMMLFRKVGMPIEKHNETLPTDTRKQMTSLSQTTRKKSNPLESAKGRQPPPRKKMKRKGRLHRWNTSQVQTCVYPMFRLPKRGSSTLKISHNKT